MATLEELKDMRAKNKRAGGCAPCASHAEAAILAASDMIERHEQAARALTLADCEVDVAVAGHVEVVTLTHLPTGQAFAGATQDEALTALRKALVSPFGDRPEDRPFGDAPTVVTVTYRAYP